MQTPSILKRGAGDASPHRGEAGGAGDDSSVWAQPLGRSAAVQHDIEKQKKASYCNVFNCRSNSLLNPTWGFFKVPSDSQRAREWLERIHQVKSKLKKVLVCEKHFEARYVNRSNEQRTRLVMHAVPTLFLPQPEALTCTPDVGAASHAPHAPHAAAGRLRAALAGDATRAVRKPRKRHRVTPAEARRRIQAFVHQSRHPGNCNRHIAEIILLNKRFSDRRDGWKYTDEFKFFALKLYCSSPKTYKTMQSLLCLPRISTLYRFFIPSSSNVCENLIIALKIKVDSMTAEQKECAVCIGTLDVKQNLYYDVKNDQVIGFHDVDGTQRLEPASTALVVMVRGLYHNWKQALSCSFLAPHQDYEDVRAYVLKIISKMFEIGLTVRVLISDVETDFIGLTKAKKITSKAPFFHVNNYKVYHLYDPVHLVKNVRDYFTTNNFYFNGKIAKWEHITESYDYERNKPLRLAPQLSAYHIIHTHLQSEKDKVVLAAQVFSAQTAAALAAHRELRVLDEPVDGTVEWLLLMNTLCNTLNFTSYVPHDAAAAAFSGEPAQLAALDELSAVFKDLRLVDAHKGSDCTNSAKITSRLRSTLKAIVSLHKDLSLIYNKFPTFMSRDCLDLFFDKVHKVYGRLPTCRQIQLLASGKTPIFNIFQSTINKELDCLDFFLKEAIEFSSIVMVYERAQRDAEHASYAATAGAELDALALAGAGALLQLAAFLLYEAYRHHSDCERTKSYTFENADSTTVILTIKSKHQTDTNVVVMVPAEFVEFVESMELTIKLYFETECQRSVLKGLMGHLLSENVTFSMPCQCFPLDYIKCLYMRYRFNLIIKSNNMEYDKAPGDCRKHLVVKEL
ncbi:hypothetical protein PYW07_004865 [Mythimna separata]|uniref:THAP-type domain-containing protein n=1 Tax=Mythimna separata TaxID=271217 RepID=A0AAD7YEF5_MYTSE|nr:hypothetical protein PYW07_004865 [Mythimna separata]